MARRSDRLLDLATLLRDGRLHRAEDLARRLQVSVRTIYRDMDTLIASGVPIAGERGLGYIATAAVTLPPLSLTQEELAALQGALAADLGAAGTAGDAPRAAALQGLIAKIDSALPEATLPPGAAPQGLAIAAFGQAALGFQHLGALRSAIRARQKLRLRVGGAEAVLWPLHLDYWGRVWVLTAWDEGKGTLCRLRADLIEGLRALPMLFSPETVPDLAAWTARGPRA